MPSQSQIAQALTQLFPGSECTVDSDGTFFVSWLPRNAQPASCEVLARAAAPAPLGYRREYFLVRAAGLMLFFRICSASQWTGNAECVVGEGVAATLQEQRRLEAHARARIAAHCGAPVAEQKAGHRVAVAAS